MVWHFQSCPGGTVQQNRDEMFSRAKPGLLADNAFLWLDGIAKNLIAAGD